MNGEHGLFDSVFKGAVALGGTLIGGVTMWGGKKLVEHDREIGELKVGQANMVLTLGDIKSDIRAIRAHLEGHK